MPLSECRHRGPENVYGRFSCTSPHRPFKGCGHPVGVTLGCCLRCPVPDQGAPLLPTRKPAPPKGDPTPAPRSTPALPDGPGSELERVLKEHRLTRVGCGGCQGLRKRMDRWGPAGCRDRREQILARLRRAYRELTPAETAAAAWHALWSGLAFKVDPRDPAPGLLDEALRRWAARAKAPGPGAVNSKAAGPAGE